MQAETELRSFQTPYLETDHSNRGAADREIRYKAYKEKQHLCVAGKGTCTDRYEK